MTDADFKQRLIGHLLAIHKPWGRRRMGLYIGWKRWSWRCVVASSYLLKRCFDLIVSLIALVVLFPVFLGISILVKADGGPVFFRQTRIGRMGREFKMLKFRSMVVDAEARLKDLLAHNEKASGVTFKMKEDPRITRIGRILRKSSLDELPQFWNVLVGDMSLVGPRPPVRREVELYTQEDRRRLLVRPGITCLWQIGERNRGFWEIGDRNAIDFPEQVALDVRYIENRSFLGDLWILAKTIPAILFGKGA